MGELLILKGADMNAKTKDIKKMNGKIRFHGGMAPLHYAANNNAKEIGELLISKGADINIKDILSLNIKL